MKRHNKFPPSPSPPPPKAGAKEAAILRNSHTPNIEAKTNIASELRAPVCKSRLQLRVKCESNSLVVSKAII